MALFFPHVNVSVVNNTGSTGPKYDHPLTVSLEYDPQGLSIKLWKEGQISNEEVSEIPIHRNTECARVGTTMYVFTIDSETLFFRFMNESDAKNFHIEVAKMKSGEGKSSFTERTDDSSAMQYFQFYGYLSQQQNMLQDYVRTSTYQKAILSNLTDFTDKVVLDVGAGSGILSFFAVQAGAKKVYAVEASTMAQHAEFLVRENHLSDKIIVMAGKIEEITLPEQVDVIISEPMGYMLYNERMLETYLHAKKWLKPHGRMFPSQGDLHIAPFTDDTLYMEQSSKANFWFQHSFHGVDLSSLRHFATKEYFRQPIVDTFDVRVCMAKSVRHSLDFKSAQEQDLHHIDIPLEFHVLESGSVHGLAFWFDVAFGGSVQTVWLSTAPTEPLTHWYQVRCLLETPIFVKTGQVLKGSVVLLANKRQSYDVTIDLFVEGTNTRSTNTLDLKNPYFRYSGQAAAPPPGMNYSSPSEAYWNQLDAHGARQESNNIIVQITVDAEPEAVEPEIAEPEAVEPEIAEPDTTEPDTTEPRNLCVPIVDLTYDVPSPLMDTNEDDEMNSIGDDYCEVISPENFQVHLVTQAGTLEDNDDDDDDYYYYDNDDEDEDDADDEDDDYGRQAPTPNFEFVEAKSRYRQDYCSEDDMSS